MIKRTLYFGNPARLSTENEQLRVEIITKDETGKEERTTKSVPIEDIGVVVLDHWQITITHGVLSRLMANNVALIACDDTMHPAGLMMPLSVNTVQSERFQDQISATEPLKKQLWQQTVKAKIKNQARVLEMLNKPFEPLMKWAEDVKSGDGENHEARAAAFYWRHIFAPKLDFFRNRGGLPPNNLLNYGYAILRACVARSLVASGLLPTLGIHHRNKYNAYCLADDIMEPYRPFVDFLVNEIMETGLEIEELNTDLKKELLQIPVLDILINGERSPLMVGLQQTTASLAKCYEGIERKLIYPTFPDDQA